MKHINIAFAQVIIAACAILSVEGGEREIFKPGGFSIALTPILRPRIGTFKMESVSLRYMP